MIATVAASTTVAAALTAYLVKTVNLRLLHSGEPLSAAEGRGLVRSWQRGNLVRLLLLGVAAWALRQTAPPGTSQADG
jgi:hypothetical protein